MNFSFETRHSPSETRHSSSETRHSSSETRHSSSETRHSSSETRHSSFETWHSSSEIKKAVSTLFLSDDTAIFYVYQSDSVTVPSVHLSFDTLPSTNFKVRHLPYQISFKKKFSFLGRFPLKSPRVSLKLFLPVREVSDCRRSLFTGFPVLTTCFEIASVRRHARYLNHLLVCSSFFGSGSLSTAKRRILIYH